eukprot:7390840-Prymnesium_polylepis.2
MGEAAGLEPVDARSRARERLLARDHLLRVQPQRWRVQARRKPLHIEEPRGVRRAKRLQRDSRGEGRLRDGAGRPGGVPLLVLLARRAAPVARAHRLLPRRVLGRHVAPLQHDQLDRSRRAAEQLRERCGRAHVIVEDLEAADGVRAPAPEPVHHGREVAHRLRVRTDVERRAQRRHVERLEAGGDEARGQEVEPRAARVEQLHQAQHPRMLV